MDAHFPWFILFARWSVPALIQLFAAQIARTERSLLSVFAVCASFIGSLVGSSRLSRHRRHDRSSVARFPARRFHVPIGVIDR